VFTSHVLGNWQTDHGNNKSKTCLTTTNILQTEFSGAVAKKFPRSLFDEREI
jgi:hypothetical protein